jgi:hypothetical protein
MPEMVANPEESATVAGIRRILLVVLLIGLMGMGVELLLLKHFEEVGQLIPLVLIGVALASTLWHVLRRGPGSLRILQIAMVFFIAAGLLGVFLHYGANVEFQREVDPSLVGTALFWRAIAAKSPPPLAPGSMAQLGLIGLAYTYRHPAISRHPAGDAFEERVK